MVTFRLFAAARASAGTSEVQLAAGPTRRLLAQLSAAHPPRFAEVLAACSLMSEGRRLDPGSDDPLPDGAVVDVLPPFAGG